MRNLIYIVFSVFAFAYSQVAFSQAVATAYAFERFMVAAKGSGWTTGANALGKPVAMGPASLTKAYSGTLTSGTGVASGAGATGVAVSKSIGSAAAGEMSVTANGLLTAANVLGAFQLIASGPVGGALGTLIVAPAVMEWLAYYGMKWSSDPSSANPFEAADIAVNSQCDTGPTVTANASNSCKSSGFVSGVPVATRVPDANYCTLVYRCKSSNGDVFNKNVGSTGLVDGYSLDTHLAAWPELNRRVGASALPVPVAVVQTLLDVGASIPIVYPKGDSPTDSYFPAGVLSVVGPATVLGTPTVTKTNDGTNTTTTTTTPKTTLSYSTSTNSEGKSVPTVTASPGASTSVSVTNNTTNVTTVISNTEVDAPAEKDQKTDCEKTPDIASCQELDVPDGEIPKANKEITYTSENTFGGGSCPADLFTTLHTGQRILVFPWNRACNDISTYLRPIIILMGAISAMLILIPGKD